MLQSDYMVLARNACVTCSNCRFGCGKTYRAKSQRQEKDADESEEFDILTQPGGYSTFDDGACSEQLYPTVRHVFLRWLVKTYGIS